MNVPLIDAKFTDAMPEILAGEPWMQALANVVQRHVRRLIERENYCSIYNRLDEMPEWVLDAIAVNIRAETYRQTDDIQAKCDNIRFALWGNNIKGTVAATEGLAWAVFGADGVAVEEWFDYGDDPGYFQIVTYDRWLTENMLQDFVKQMDGYKRLSIWLRRFLMQFAFDQLLYLCSGVSLYTRTYGGPYSVFDEYYREINEFPMPR